MNNLLVKLSANTFYEVLPYLSPKKVAILAGTSRDFLLKIKNEKSPYWKYLATILSGIKNLDSPTAYKICMSHFQWANHRLTRKISEKKFGWIPSLVSGTILSSPNIVLTFFNRDKDLFFYRSTINDNRHRVGVLEGSLPWNFLEDVLGFSRRDTRGRYVQLLPVLPENNYNYTLLSGNNDYLFLVARKRNPLGDNLLLTWDLRTYTLQVRMIHGSNCDISDGVIKFSKDNIAFSRDRSKGANPAIFNNRTSTFTVLNLYPENLPHLRRNISESIALNDSQMIHLNARGVLIIWELAALDNVPTFVQLDLSSIEIEINENRLFKIVDLQLHGSSIFAVFTKYMEHPYFNENKAEVKSYLLFYNLILKTQWIREVGGINCSLKSLKKEESSLTLEWLKYGRCYHPKLPQQLITEVLSLVIVRKSLVGRIRKSLRKLPPLQQALVLVITGVAFLAISFTAIDVLIKRPFHN
jgi:hypothetical protein